MSSKNLYVDLSLIDVDNPIADIETIRQYNPQRHEMEQLTAIVYENIEKHQCVGYKDITREEFWIRGHMPGMPLMPGVVMLEAMAQLSSYFVQAHNLLDAQVVGFGGLEEVRFRGPVVPGDRLFLICELTKVRPRRMIVCRFQGVVNGTIVVDGVLKGIPLPVDSLQVKD
ncbi:3-hydroxyacyl-ACP dehydratase FabZ family protein [Lignipirellula cremea]|uniref:3-hydroxyacyl-[acyl-carrier-protein] dehydratase FabZ n=1 Tax=Lignipirellula cremea TaxID=2528010 RepID=A0A518E3M1_9BACT|nr:3-hydroxyacyl-ACP dehydratase FabZ family protein [Lignipirellula cremea]QDU98672.1 3-hydroxyacyl-[acyl-carrier-protein] dehydratase FabZ [Lignipirellula cremea]